MKVYFAFLLCVLKGVWLGESVIPLICWCILELGMVEVVFSLFCLLVVCLKGF